MFAFTEAIDRVLAGGCLGVYIADVGRWNAVSLCVAVTRKLGLGYPGLYWCDWHGVGVGR
jgi:hypothetical protein